MDKERYRKGAHTVLDLKYHCVWKTKYSHPVLSGEIGLGLRRILREIATEKQIEIIKGNIRANHIHLLVSAPSYHSPAKIMQYLKGKSSYRLQREYGKILKKHYWGQHIWSRGYFCATVGAVTEEQVKAYIEHQDDESKDVQVWDEKLETDLSGN
jgi:putative transposase